MRILEIYLNLKFEDTYYDLVLCANVLCPFLVFDLRKLLQDLFCVQTLLGVFLQAEFQLLLPEAIEKT